MLVVLAILSAGLLGFIIYLAFSPKSSRLMKRAALIALGLIVLSVGICAIFLIIGPAEDDDIVPFPVFADTPPAPPRQENVVETVIFATVFLIIMAVIVALAVRDRRRKETQIKNPEKKPALTNTDPLDGFGGSSAEKDSNNMDDLDFDLGLDLDDDNK